MNSTSNLNLHASLEEKFIGFLDVMGFSNLVNSGCVVPLESYFEKISEVLDHLNKDETKIKSFLISDSIILIAPKGLQGFKQLIIAIRRIQSIILGQKILLRGAVSYGQVYYNKDRNIIVGKGFIRAYLLEQEAIYPRVIIDPAIIKLIARDKTAFIKLLNKTLDFTFGERLIYTSSKYTKIPDDGIFVDYANKSIQEKSLNENLKKVYETIIDNLYSDQKLYSKYLWLKNYFLEILTLTHSELVEKSSERTHHEKELTNWIEKFARL